ncbi:MAG: ABC transporter substrate-binding protein [Defluviitaleaceae bacterium]|nr:ABC transporter substrate-binding protein [Defluviitaleaceae bacterium]
MKKKKALSLVLAGILLIAALGACGAAPNNPNVTQTTTSQDTQPAPAADTSEATQQETGLGRGIILALNAETPSVAPARHTALIGSYKNDMTHNGLFRFHYNTMEPVPDLVTGWTALSDTLFEFTLREDVFFHNGDKLTAHDVAASLAYVRTHPEARTFHVSIADWEVIDEYTVRIDTGVPDARLFFDLCSHANFIMPISLIEAGHDFTVEPIGSGSFVFDEWIHGDSLTFRAFDNYFDTERRAKIEYVTWRVIPEGASRTIALEAGEVDYIMDVSFPDIPRLEANPDITVFMRPGNTFQYFIFNNDRPIFQNIHVRHAIDMALDREAMLTASLDGYGIPIWHAMPPMFAGASDEGIRSFDPEGARALLASEGIDPESLAFDMLAFNEEQRRRAEVVQSNLLDIGIPTTITMIDFAAWLTFTLGDTFDTSFANFTVSNLQTLMRTIMHRDNINAQNRARKDHQELSDLIDRALATIDTGERIAILEEASKIANEYAGFLGTNMTMMVRAFNANLVAPEIAANGSMFLNMVYWAN